MTPSSCALMAAYNRWMNERLYDAAASLSDRQVTEDRGAYFGSLFGTLNHIAVADAIWLHRFAQHPGLPELGDLLAGFPRPDSLRQPLAESLPDLRTVRDGLDAVIAGFAAHLTEELLASTLAYADTAGRRQARNLRGLVQHFFNHQTHHRGQATTLLSQLGVDMGVTDLLALVPNEA